MNLPATDSGVVKILEELLEIDDYCLSSVGDDCAHKDASFLVVDVVEGDDGRWTRYDEVVVQHKQTGDYYAFDYEVGLTENQECGPFDSGINIWPVTKLVKVVETAEWVKP